MSEYRTRSILKAISWRCIATFATISIVFVFTKKLILALEIGLVEVTAKIIFYYLHERMWGRVKWGKLKHPLNDIKLKKPLSPQDKKKIEEHLRNLGYF